MPGSCGDAYILSVSFSPSVHSGADVLRTYYVQKARLALGTQKQKGTAVPLGQRKVVRPSWGKSRKASQEHFHRVQENEDACTGVVEGCGKCLIPEQACKTRKALPC